MSFDRSAPAQAMQAIRRNATVQAVQLVTGRPRTEVAQRLYGELGPDAVLRAATTPASTDGWGGSLAGSVVVGEFLRSLRAQSAAAQLFDRTLRVDLSGVGSASLPRLATDFPDPAWVAEGAPIPAAQGSLTSVTMAPKKLAAIAGLTTELADLAAEDAEAVVEGLMRAAMSHALDVSLLSNAAASALRPAGILNGVTATTATAGGGMSAFATDMKNLANAVATAGGGANLVIIAAPGVAMSLKVLAGAAFDYPVIVGPHLSAGTVIMLDIGALASGFSDVPRIDVGKDAVIHWDDAPTTQIGTAGSPNVIAAPVRSGFQQAIFAIRIVLRGAWTMRLPAIAWLNGSATW